MIIRDGDWILHDTDSAGKRQVWSRENLDGTVTYRTDYHVDDIVDANAEIRSQTAGQQYGDWRLIASVPIAKHFGELAPAQDQRDSRYIDNWLNEHSAFKTFR